MINVRILICIINFFLTFRKSRIVVVDINEKRKIKYLLNNY